MAGALRPETMIGGPPCRCARFIRTRWCHGEELHVVEVEEPPVMRDRCTAPQGTQHPDRLVGSGTALRHRHADRRELVRELTTDADADRHAASRPRIEIGELLRHDHRVVQREEEDRGADPDALRPRGHAARAA